MMKKLTKSMLAAGLLTASAAASAELSVNVGAMSDYWFRGVDQTDDNASLMGGIDYDFGNGFYVGTWEAQLDDSELEYDLYGGYSGEYKDFTYGIGYTGYFYTTSNASDFHELILNAGYKFFSLTGEYEGAYLTYGVFGQDYEGDYVEAGYGTNFQGVDLGLAYIHQLDEEIDGDNEQDSQLVFTFSKTFDF
jgi:uncharacterized protein (TIGR02001 family)